MAQKSTQITQLYPHQGWNEIDPEEVWTKFQSVFNSALEGKWAMRNRDIVLCLWNTYSKLARIHVFVFGILEADATAADIKSFGLSVQRSTFVTWDKRTGKTFHNFITWKDLRADHLVKSWNNSWTIHVNIGKNILIIT